MKNVRNSSKNTPELSVVVPAYNIENYIGRCIESLLKQDTIDLEIIIVDDGSTDRTGSIAEEYAAAESRIKVVHQENQGLYKARTCGVRFASAEYVTFCDGDDYIDKDFYGCVLEKIKEYGCDVLQFGYKKVKNNKVIWKFEPRYREMSGREALKSMLETLQFANYNWCKLYRKSLFDGIEFNENVKCNDEDVLLQVKILPDARKVYSIPIAGYNYDIREGSIVHRARGMEGINILNTDRIIYEYALGRLDQELCKSVAYDYSAKLAYWYNKCSCAGYKAKAREINELFRMIVKKNHLFGYFPKDASCRRVMMIHSLYICPPLCKMLYKIAVKG